jgi:hypothetical protein
VFSRSVEEQDLKDPYGPLFCCPASQHLVIGAVSTVLAERFELMQAARAKRLPWEERQRLLSWAVAQIGRMKGSWPRPEDLARVDLWSGLKTEQVLVFEAEEEQDWRATEVLYPLLYAVLRSLLESLELLRPEQALGEVLQNATPELLGVRPTLRLRPVLAAAAPAARKWSALSESDARGFRHAVAKDLGVELVVFDRWLMAQPFNLQQLQVKGLEIYNTPGRIAACGGLFDRLMAPDNFTPAWMLRALRPLQVATMGTGVKQEPAPPVKRRQRRG